MIISKSALACIAAVQIVNAATTASQILPKTFEDEYADFPLLYDIFYRLGAIYHGIYPEQGLSNSYDWFTNLEDPNAPQTAEGVFLAVLDESLAELVSSCGCWLAWRALDKRSKIA